MAKTCKVTQHAKSCKKYIFAVFKLIVTNAACADPESFVKGSPNLITFFLVDEGI